MFNYIYNFINNTISFFDLASQSQELVVQEAAAFRRAYTISINGPGTAYGAWKKRRPTPPDPDDFNTASGPGRTPIDQLFGFGIDDPYNYYGDDDNDGVYNKDDPDFDDPQTELDESTSNIFTGQQEYNVGGVRGDIASKLAETFERQDIGTAGKAVREGTMDLGVEDFMGTSAKQLLEDVAYQSFIDRIGRGEFETGITRPEWGDYDEGVDEISIYGGDDFDASTWNPTKEQWEKSKEYASLYSGGNYIGKPLEAQLETLLPSKTALDKTWFSNYMPQFGADVKSIIQPAKQIARQDTSGLAWSPASAARKGIIGEDIAGQLASSITGYKQDASASMQDILDDLDNISNLL